MPSEKTPPVTIQPVGSRFWLAGQAEESGIDISKGLVEKRPLSVAIFAGPGQHGWVPHVHRFFSQTGKCPCLLTKSCCGHFAEPYRQGKFSMIRHRHLLAAALVAAGTLFAGGASANCDTSISLINRSGVELREFYYNPTSNSNWGRDRLGDNTLPPGRSMSFRPGRGVRHDFKVVWMNDEEAEVRNVDVCTVAEIVATKSGIVAR